MSEGGDKDDKTEEPTAKRLDDAKKKGQVVTSQEVKSFFILLGGLMVVTHFLPEAFEQIISHLRRFIALPHQVMPDEASISDFVGSTMGHVFLALLLPFLMMMVFGLASSIIQTGPMYSPEATKIKWSKLNPMSGLKRLFSINSLLEFVKSFLKTLIVGAVGYSVIQDALQDVDQYAAMPLPEVLRTTGELVGKMMGSVVATVAIIGILDYIQKRFDFMKNMRMSKQEIKDEVKQADGDPKIKGRIRQLRMQKSRQRMMAAIPTADVVITNPTHYAVALEYKPEEMAAPVVVAKGMNLIAERIKALAEEHKVTIVSNPPLARALHDNGEIDAPIPFAQYQAVAEVISFIFRMRRERGGKK
ncbi:MAG TPA: flagellar biosynthesis protein FlhB [Alphaproteobacteria bacterium]|nr:flagellar biosynthesis protein FlhB [Rhodospirillaceae bacterium]HRJ12337.1 flagellar biosynthesis protein FlhB [Alphaproteobacteria bacterium]